MVKDLKKYAASGGWRFGQFTNGKPDDEALHKTCFPCHQPAKGTIWFLRVTRLRHELSPTLVHQSHGANHDSRSCGAPNFGYEVRSCGHSSFGYRPEQALLRGSGLAAGRRFCPVRRARAVQLTPPGSPSSIQLGSGPAARFYLAVSDIEAARADFVARGVDASEIFHRGVGKDSRLSGLDPERRSYASFVTFDDPDGNNWLVQEVTQRLPGRVSADTATFTSSTDLAAALRRAAAAHGEHEKRTGQHDAEWADWYAEYIVRERTGQPLPS
jgi:hypothetical protein